MDDNHYLEFFDQTESVQDKRRRIGSTTAKGGFKNEHFIVEKFNNWKTDTDAKVWLKIMDYEIRLLDSLEAIQIPTVIKKDNLDLYNIEKKEYEKFVRFKKADAQIKLIIKIGNIVKYEYISIKKANKEADFNQIDKRTVDFYQLMWNFDDEIRDYLKLFTGETKPSKSIFKNLRENRRVYINEMPINIQSKIIGFFEDNKFLVVSDILKGRGGLSAGWMLVTRKDSITKELDYVLKDINTTINFYCKGNVCITKKGSLSIGKIFMQRKGGTPDPTKLQFKFGPCQLFEIK
jgi:hypothetical protein